MVEPSTGSLRYLLALHDVLYLVPPVGVDPLAPECRDNSECPPHAACINRQCLNPCAVTDPCAVNAFCRVQNHEPVCTCPAGYLGDPRVSCTKRKFILVFSVPLICKDMAWKNWSWMRTYQHIQNHLALNQLTSSSVRVWYNSTTADAGRKEPVSMCTSRHLATYPIRSTACVDTTKIMHSTIWDICTVLANMENGVPYTIVQGTTYANNSVIQTCLFLNDHVIFFFQDFRRNLYIEENIWEFKIENIIIILLVDF